MFVAADAGDPDAVERSVTAVVYLAGPEAAFISGAVLLIDGGNGAGLPA